MTERMWRVVAVYRVVTMIYAAVLIIRDHDQYAHPTGGIAILAVIIFWTSVTVVAYSRPGGRQRWLIVADVIVTAALVYSTRWVDTPSRIAHGSPTLPSFWAASPVLACAVAFGPWLGMTAALVIASSDYAERPQLSLENPFSNIVLLLIAGGIGGYIVRLGVQAEEAVARVSRKEAAIAERERLARDIHDSVLQVLTRVSSRGRALGGEAAELGHLAAEQESALRRMITGTAPGPAASLAGVPTADAMSPAASEGEPARVPTASSAAAGQALSSADTGDGPAATGQATSAPEGVAAGSLAGLGGTGLAPVTADPGPGAVAGGPAIPPSATRGLRPGRGFWPGRLGKPGAVQAGMAKTTRTKASDTKATDAKAASTKATSNKAISTKAVGTKALGTKALGTKARAAKAAIAPDGTDEPVDLRELIEPFADPQVTVSCPASPVPLPAAAAAALSGATAAALDNVRQHAGPDAHAWVLVEDAGDTVRVSIRDNGIGFADDRLAKATAAGRLGVSHSIVGRLREVGGTAWVTSGPGQGTEVELAVPRTRPSGPRPHRGRSSDLA
jgi:signal transduction histidine kinase